MIDVLTSKNLWRLVTHEHKKPTDAQALIKWEEKFDQARGLIGQRVSNSLQVSIDTKDNPVEVWEILASLFNKSNDVSYYYLEKKIHELDPTNFDRVELYLAKFKTLNEKLNNWGKYQKTYTTLIILIKQKLPFFLTCSSKLKIGLFNCVKVPWNILLMIFLKGLYWARKVDCFRTSLT